MPLPDNLFVPRKQFDRELVRLRTNLKKAGIESPALVSSAISDHLIKNTTQQFLEVERWAGRFLDTLSTLYIVVASDGSGDFTSIKDACDSVAANTSAYIYVKQGTYSDLGRGTIDISDKCIKIMAIRQGTGLNSTLYQAISVDSFTGTSGTFLRLEGFVLNTANTSTRVMIGNGKLNLDSVYVLTGLVVAGGGVWATNSIFNYGLASGTDTSIGTLYTLNCFITFNSSTTSSDMICLGGYLSKGNGGAIINCTDLVWSGCGSLDNGQSGTVTINAIGSSASDGAATIVGCEWVAQNANSVNSGFAGFALTVNSPKIALVGNSFCNTLSANTATGTLASGHISGAYRGLVTLAGVNWTGAIHCFAGQFSSGSIAPITVLSVTASSCVLTATFSHLSGGTTSNPACVVSGSNNIITAVMRAASNWTAVFSDLGAGNFLNTLPPSAHASTHLPSGTDPLTTAAAGTILPDDTAAVGTANSFARSDHRHAIAAGTPGSINPGDAAAEGVSTSFARADHVHAAPATWPSTGGSKFSATLAAGSTSYNVDHNFGTLDVVVQVRDNATGVVEYPTITSSTINRVVVDFSVATTSDKRAVVTG